MKQNESMRTRNISSNLNATKTQNNRLIDLILLKFKLVFLKFPISSSVSLFLFHSKTHQTLRKTIKNGFKNTLDPRESDFIGKL